MPAKTGRRDVGFIRAIAPPTVRRRDGAAPRPRELLTAAGTEKSLYLVVFRLLGEARRRVAILIS
jgi:hypothetical protein